MNAEREDIGVLHNYELDLAFGSDENSFECVVAQNNHCCGFGFYLYIEGTEYGGIIDSVESKDSTQEVVYSGRTWHGVLDSKVLEPGSGEDYLVCNGEANAVIADLVSRMGLSDLFVVSGEASGLAVTNYKMNRYISGYEGIMKMLKTVGGKLLFCVQRNGQVLLSAVPVVDYTKDGLDSDLIDLDVKRTANTVNHLICLGKGNLSERLVVHLYADENGNISRNQTFTGVKERVAVYDYANAEDEAELVEGGTEKLKELMQQDSLSVDVNDVGDPYDIGDLVGATNNTTNISITVPIQKKIVTIKNGIVTIDIKTETSTASSYTSGGFSGGASDADASGQIAEHNTDSSAHADIRSALVNEVVSLKNGTSIPKDRDLNTYVTIGNYKCTGANYATTLANCPTTATFKMVVGHLILYSASTHRFQEIEDSNGHVYWRRTRDGGATWSEWLHRIDGSMTIPIKNGGTGGTTAEAARNNLSVYSKAEVDLLLQQMMETLQS